MSLEKERHRLIILGGGAAGLFAALSASLYTDDILVIDRNQAPGKKITATGNGKCNLTHVPILRGDYDSSDPDTVQKILSAFDPSDTLALFTGIGVPVINREGYCYPLSRRASSVRDALVRACIARGVEFINDTRVKEIVNVGSGFTVNGAYSCDSIVAAFGGSASKGFGTEGSGVYLLGNLGLRCRKVFPALVGLKTDHKLISSLSGVRTECSVCMTSETVKSLLEEGEMIFSANGFSGIPVMNLSGYALRALDDADRPVLHVNLLPGNNPEETCTYLSGLFKRYPDETAVNLLSGIINEKISGFILKEAGIMPDSTAKDIADNLIRRLTGLLFDLRFNITGDQGYENAQVSSGGILLSELNPETLESKNIPHLFVAGETLDATGRCGGYNLQWAWTTGAIAGANAAGGRFDKDKFIKAFT